MNKAFDPTTADEGSQLAIAAVALEAIARGLCVTGGSGNDPCAANQRDDEWCFPHLARAALEEMIRVLLEEQVLILLVNRVPNNRPIIPGKIFEYLRTGNPVLGIGPTGSEAGDTLKESTAGQLIDYAAIALR